MVSEQLAASIAGQRGIQPTYGYYRQSNGWITFSTITRLEKVKYLEQGWQSLDQYGTFDASPYMLNHPFEPLFMFGGVHELPVDQIIQMGLYMDPPMVPVCGRHLTQYHRGHERSCWVGAKRVEFPQLEGLDVLTSPCGYCERVLPTTKALEQHQSVAHKDSLRDIQTGRSLGTTLAEVMGTPTLAPAEAEEMQRQIEELKELVATLTPESKSRKNQPTEALRKLE